MLQKLISTGVTLRNKRWLNRNIKITNEVAALCCVIMALLAGIHAITHPGESWTIAVTIMMTAAFALVVVCNGARRYNLARTLLTCMLTIGVLALSITRKTTNPESVTEIMFMQPRVALIVFSILPFAFFHFREWRMLVLNLAFGFLAVVLFDPINNAFGVGFYDFEFTNPEYYYHNVFTIVIYVILTGAAGLFKHTIDSYETRNENLIEALHHKNETVQEQRQQLESQSRLLKQLLDERDEDLYSVTHEIMRFNIELQQYSYALSHNLRGPVASLLGLLDLLETADTEERDHILQQLRAPVNNLDNTLRALNNIVGVQHDTFSIREKIHIPAEVNVVMESLREIIHKYNVGISLDIQVTDIFASRQRVHFILMCLFRNAIQYRRPDVTPEIVFSTRRHAEAVVFEVTDNGRGLDLDRYREHLFKPFKVFHKQASGQGLSLYFLKLHLKKLHGKVEVKSAPGKGATFSVYVRDWEETSS